MHAHDRSILSLLGGPGQFIIPKFQRPYRWNDDQCLTLLDDVEQAATPAVTGERHFLGSIVYRQLSAVHGYARSLLIDGQQRLTTLTLILCVLRELSRDIPQRRGQIDQWLGNPHRDGLQRYKLILRDADQEGLQHIVDHGIARVGDTGTVARRYRTLREAVQGQEPELILRGLDNTCHVDVVLENQDNHQAIFESLNAKFEPLSLLDKVRNFALMGLDEDEMTHVWDGPWRIIEDRYGSGRDEDRRRKEDAFGLLARDLLVLAGVGERRRDEEPYARIKRWARRWETGQGDGNVRFISYLAEQAKRHAAFTLGVATPEGLEEPLARCRRLSDTPGPVVLRLLGALGDTLNVNDVRRALHTIESVLVRRRCCGLASGAERDAFARIGRTLKPRCTPDDIDRAVSRVLRGSRRPPGDDEFIKALVDRAMPRSGPLVPHILVGLENAGKEKVAMPLTIEHVLPQTPNLPDDWQKMLGKDWQETHSRCVQRLGNLTLTAYNSELGARPLKAKQEMDGGYRTSKAVWLNSDLKDADTWNEARIAARGRRMAERATQLWPQLTSVEDDELDSLELDPGAGGPILTASDWQKAWRTRGASDWTVEENGVRLQQAVAAALLRMDRRGPNIASRAHPFVREEGDRLHTAIGHGVEGFIYRALNQGNRREWLEQFADAIEREYGTTPTIGSAADPGDIDVWLPSSPGSTAAYPLSEKRRKEVEASVNCLRSLRLDDSGTTLEASSDSRRAWRIKDGRWQVFGSATATLASLARWLANRDRRGPAAFFAACPWHFTHGATEYVGRAVVVDLDHDVMLRYEHLGTYPASRDFAWRMCQQVETETGHAMTLGRDVELWMPDSATQRVAVGREHVKPRRTELSKAEFLESCDAYGRAVFSRILDLENHEGVFVRWRTTSFSLEVDVDGARVEVCTVGQPGSKFKQAVQTSLGSDNWGIRTTGAPSEVVEQLWKKAVQTGLFAPVGIDLRCLVDRAFTDHEMDALVAWCVAAGQAIRELRGAPTEGPTGPDSGIN